MDPSTEEVVIPLDRRMLGVLLVAATAFVVVGLLLMLIPGLREGADGWQKIAAGLACVVFFSAAAVALMQLIRSKKPGLIVTDRGFVDASSGVAAGDVSWEQVESIGFTNVKGGKFVTVMVKDPQTFVQRGGLIKRLLSRLNARIYSSPVQISARSLAISHDELAQLLMGRFALWQRSQSE